jgi:ATP-binding cassette subfamily C exporter for protease/lipase
MPKFIVLDEPNSSLDEEGDAALLRTLQYIKSKGSTLIIITHRVQVMSVIDSILLLVDGKIKALGPRDEVLKSLISQNPSPTKPKAGATP